MSDLYSPVVDSLTTAGIEGRHVKKRIGEIAVLDAFAGRRVTDELEALLLEIDTSTLAGLAEWPHSKGFEVRPEPLASGPAGRTRIQLQLLEERYREVFRVLCADVCGVMAKAADGTEAIRLFHGRLIRWQTFLQKHGPEGLSEQARCGLFGELLVLRDVLLPTVRAGTALRAWRGCKKAHQDFQFPDLALEVKTTRAPIPNKISISNVQQLEQEGMEHMFLTLAHVNENETVGETLPEMISDLRASLPDDAGDLLNTGLEEVGYTDAHQDLYSRTRYQHIGMSHFEVRDGFPRFTREQVPSGVTNVRYDISIEACRPFQVDEAVVVELLKDG